MRFFTSILNILKFNRRNWKAVVLCIFAATVFWFLNSLNKTYTTNLSFPLSFEFDQENFIPVTELPDEVRLNVTGNGWDLFKRSTGIDPGYLEIPLDRPSEVKKIDAGSLHRFFSQQVDGLDINFSLTDTLHIDIEPKETRWVKLGIDSAYLDLETGYVLASPISIIPDSIEIEGPQRLVRGFEEPLLLRLRQHGIDEHFMKTVEINMPSDGVIGYRPKEVTIKFDVERLVTIEDSVRIEVENVPSTISEVQEKFIPITLSMPENVAKEFSIDSVRAVLDLRDFVRGEAVIFPRIEGLPPFSQVVKVDSVRIRL